MICVFQRAILQDKMKRKILDWLLQLLSMPPPLVLMLMLDGTSYSFTFSCTVVHWWCTLALDREHWDANSCSSIAVTQCVSERVISAIAMVYRTVYFYPWFFFFSFFFTSWKIRVKAGHSMCSFLPIRRFKRKEKRCDVFFFFFRWYSFVLYL